MTRSQSGNNRSQNGSGIKPWTTAELSRLREMMARGICRERIMRELGRTYQAVGSAIVRHGIASRVQRAWTIYDDEALIRAINRGQSVARVAADTDRTEKSIRARLDRLGVRLREYRRAA